MIQLNRSAINGAYNFLEGKKEEGIIKTGNVLLINGKKDEFKDHLNQ